MSDLAIRGDALHGQARAIRAIAADLASAHRQADAAAAAVGHERLAGAVHDFGAAWDIHRGRLIDAVTTLADVFDAINATMGDIDGGMTAHLWDATERAATGRATGGAGAATHAPGPTQGVTR